MVNRQQGLAISHKKRPRENVRLSSHEFKTNKSGLHVNFSHNILKVWNSMLCHIVDSRGWFLKGLDVSFHRGGKNHQMLLNSRISPLAQEVPELQFAESWEDMLGEYHDRDTKGNTTLLPRPPQLAANRYRSSRLVIWFLSFAVISFSTAILGLIPQCHRNSPMSTKFQSINFLPQVNSSNK